MWPPARTDRVACEHVNTHRNGQKKRGVAMNERRDNRYSYVNECAKTIIYEYSMYSYT